MNDKDEPTGGVEETAGDLDDNPALKDEGQVDRAAAKIREVLEEAKAKVDEAVERLHVDRARERSKEVLEEAKAKVDEAVDALKAKLRGDQ